MEFNSTYDQDMFFSFSNMKKNNGYFKSIKQREFFSKSGSRDIQFKNFSINEGQFVICIGGYVRYADYGIKSVRRVEWIFVFDSYGIVEQKKIRFQYSADGKYSAPSGEYELIWSRDSNIPHPVFDEPKPTKSEYIGMIGDRITISGVVKDNRAVGESFNGTIYKTEIVTDEDNVLIYWNNIRLDLNGEKVIAKAGDRIQFSAGIKSFCEFRGVKQTHITRVTKAKLV